MCVDMLGQVGMGRRGQLVLWVVAYKKVEQSELGPALHSPSSPHHSCVLSTD